MPSRASPSEPGRPRPRPLLDVVVGGPLCESGDIFTQQEGGFVCQRSLPMAKVGDYLVLENAGAYGSVMASNYNSRPRIAEVLVKDKKFHVIRRREEYGDLTHGEKVPAYLK